MSRYISRGKGLGTDAFTDAKWMPIELMHNDVTRLDAREECCLSSHRPGKLNNSKCPLSKYTQAMPTKTSIPRGHQAL
jgi:hypothetical protein